MSDLIERYRDLVKTGFDYAEKDKGDAPTSTFEIYIGHFSDIGREIEAALSEAEKREAEARAKALEEAALRVDAKADNYQEEARDVRGSDSDRRFCAAVAVRLRGAAADVRALAVNKPAVDSGESGDE